MLYDFIVSAFIDTINLLCKTILASLPSICSRDVLGGIVREVVYEVCEFKGGLFESIGWENVTQRFTPKWCQDAMSWEGKLLSKRKLLKVNSEIFFKAPPAVVVLTVMYRLFHLTSNWSKKKRTVPCRRHHVRPPLECNFHLTRSPAPAQPGSAIHINYGILGFFQPYLWILFSAAQFAGERKSYAKKIEFLWAFHFINWIIGRRTV